MVSIGEQFKGCRFWGYQPLSFDYVAGKQRGDAATRKAESAKIKESGFRASNMGYRKQSEAVRVATDIEAATGVAMSVFSHDYL